VLIALCGITLGIASCGEGPDAPPRRAVVSEAVESAVPVGVNATDPGILLDASAYQPATPPTGSVTERTGERTAGPDSGAQSPESQVQSLVNDFVSFIRDGEIELALGLFNAEQVQPLLDNIDPLYATADRLDRLGRALEDKLGETPAQELMSVVRGLPQTAPQWQIVNADQATVQTNLDRLLFGPVKAAPSMILARQNGVWRFQLDAPLTQDDVSKIVLYHDSLQTALDKITEYVESQQTLDEARLREMLDKAGQGEPVDVNAGEAEDATQPEGQPPGPPDRGRGQRIAPPGGP
jgi:hypothetical protein